MNTVPVTVSILDRDYQIACTEAERESLRAAAEFLDNKMREIRDRGSVIGADRIAVMAALNIAHEYLLLKPLEQERHSLAQNISILRNTIEQAIAGQEQEIVSESA